MTDESRLDRIEGKLDDIIDNRVKDLVDAENRISVLENDRIHDRKSNESLHGKMDLVLDKLVESSAKLAKHEVLHERNTQDLKEHIRRSEMIEEMVMLNKKAIEDKLVPLIKTQEYLGFGWKLFLCVSGPTVLAIASWLTNYYINK